MPERVIKILISQPEPKGEVSPYQALTEKYGVKVDFHPFIKVEPVSNRSLRENQTKLSDFTAVIFTSRNAIDHYFRIAEEMKYKVPEDTRYFCISENVAMYLQKYVVYRKRKIHVGKKTIEDLIPYIKNNSQEKFFLPSSDVLNGDVRKALTKLKISWKQGVLYKTIGVDLSHIKYSDYDIIVFFTPVGVESFVQNFPDYDQKDTYIVVFGKTAISTATKKGLKVNVKVPTKENPSMAMALEKCLSEIINRDKK